MASQGLDPFADMLSVGQHPLETVLPQVPDRFPVDAGGLHCHGRATVVLQPVGQLPQAAGGGGNDRTSCASGGDPQRTRATSVSLCTSSPAQRGSKTSIAPPLPKRRREEPSSSKSISRARRPDGRAAQSGVLAGLRVQLLNGLVAPRPSRPPSRRRNATYIHLSVPSTVETGFIDRGRSRPMRNY